MKLPVPRTAVFVAGKLLSSTDSATLIAVTLIAGRRCSAVIAGRRCSLRRGTAPTSRVHWKGYRKGQGSLSHHNDTSKILLASKHYHRIIGAVWELIMIIGAVLGVLFAKSNQFRLLLKVSLSLSPKVQRERGLT